MTIPSAATAAYRATSAITESVTNGGNQGKVGNVSDGISSFQSLLSDTVNSVVEGGQATEAKAIGVAQGDANIVDVVTAVAETEVALETMVSLRDKVIQAYEEVMRMPI